MTRSSSIMTDNRKVSFRLLYNVFKTKLPFAGIGLVFILLSLFVFVPLIVVFNASKNDYEKYDHDIIRKKGKDIKGTITSIQTQQNVTVNIVYHPQIIDYTYEENSHAKTDRFKTLVNISRQSFHVGDTVNIKAYRGQSVLVDYEPFSFPVKLFYILPAVFLLVGSPLFLMGLLPVLKHYQLYKSGTRKNATIVSLATANTVSTWPLQQNVVVHYFYTGHLGHTIIGTSISNGLHLLAEKKVQDNIDIFVSATDENKSCIVPKELY